MRCTVFARRGDGTSSAKEEPQKPLGVADGSCEPSNLRVFFLGTMSVHLRFARGFGRWQTASMNRGTIRPMLGFAWLTLRQAQDALKSGRLEEARQRLQDPGLLGHKGCGELLQQVARGFVERGEQHLKHDDTAAAWKDLLQAEGTGLAEERVGQLRQALVKHDLAEARTLLEAGEPTRAAATLENVHDHGVRHSELQLLLEVAHGWIEAQKLADKGEFAEAVQTANRIVRMLPVPPGALVNFGRELNDRSKTFAELLSRLLAATERQEWREALPLAEKMLAVAPQHVEARRVRARAWKSIEPATVAMPAQKMDLAQTMMPPEEEAGRRFMLWIDGVGGYLICLGNRVTIGQASATASVDIALVADVSRLHAALSRDSEGYLLEALRPVSVNGQPSEKTLLQSGDRVTLGSCCQLRFSQPVPVSTTAQLEVTSGHRLPLAVAKVFLMADTLVLGPGPQAHVIMPDLRQSVVLFRNRDGLGVRYPGDLVVDGVPCRERGVLGGNSRVAGDDFAFAVEVLSARQQAAGSRQ